MVEMRKSLWIEIELENAINIICGGFYREWAPGGVHSIDAQSKAIEKYWERYLHRSLLATTISANLSPKG